MCREIYEIRFDHPFMFFTLIVPPSHFFFSSLSLLFLFFSLFMIPLCAFDARTDGRGRRQRGALAAGGGRVAVQCEPDGEIRARLGHGGLAE